MVILVKKIDLDEYSKNNALALCIFVLPGNHIIKTNCLIIK